VQTWENEKDTYSISPMTVRTDGLIYSIMGLFLLCRLTVRLFSRPFGRIALPWEGGSRGNWNLCSTDTFFCV